MKELKKKDVKKGQHLWARLGSNLPRKKVYVRSIDGSQAHVSWSIGSDVVDAHVHVRHLSKTNRKRRK